MKKLTLSIIILTTAALLLSACGSTPTATAAAAVNPAVPPTLIAEGRVLPLNSLPQSFALPGQVAEVLVKDGEQVKAGQTLARLNDSPETFAALARAEQEAQAAQLALDALKSPAKLNLAQANLAVLAAQDQLDSAQSRYDANQTDENQYKLDAAQAQLKLAQDALSKLKSNQGVDPDQLANAEARLDSAKAALASARAAFDNLELKSTLDGTVIDLTLQPGQRVSAGQPVITVADLSGWLVQTDNLTEMDVVNIKLGQPVAVVLDALPQVTLSGTVTHINAQFEEKRGDITYTVTVALNNTDPQMRWGMTAAVKFLK